MNESLLHLERANECLKTFIASLTPDQKETYIGQIWDTYMAISELYKIPGIGSDNES